MCGITTLPVTIKAFMLDLFIYANKNGFDCYTISQPAEYFTEEALGGVKHIPVNIKHGNVNPLEVIKTIWKLYKIFRKEKFEIIQYATSNAAFYSSIAGFLANVPVRVFCQWGIAYTDYKGFKLWFYKTIEKLTCVFSTHVQPDSLANLKFSIEEKLYQPSKGSVILNGSACGVDMERYDISKKEIWSNEIRDLYQVPRSAKLFGYVGRVLVEKGINELLEAFLSIKDNNAYLMIVGPNDTPELLNHFLYDKAQKNKNIIFVGSVPDAAKYHAAFDFLVLPSYREGFGLVVIEAAAVATPTIVSNIKGPTDFIKHEINGFVCEVKSSQSLKEMLEKALLLDDNTKHNISQKAYQMAKDMFDSFEFKKAFVNNRLSLINNKKK